MLSVKQQTFCFGLNVLTDQHAELHKLLTKVNVFRVIQSDHVIMLFN